MRKSILFLFVILTIAACNKLDELRNFNRDLEYTGSIDIDSVQGLPDTTVVPPGGITVDLPKIANETKAQQYIEEYNTSPDKITNVIVSKMTLEMAAPDGQNFNFLDTVRVYINADGLPEELMGYKYGVPKDVKLLDLDRNDNNIKDYFLKDSIFFRISSHIVEMPQQGAKLDFKTVFSLAATPLD